MKSKLLVVLTFFVFAIACNNKNVDVDLNYILQHSNYDFLADKDKIDCVVSDKNVDKPIVKCIEHDYKDNPVYFYLNKMNDFYKIMKIEIFADGVKHVIDDQVQIAEMVREANAEFYKKRRK
ncbi:hypothetical protein OWM07_03205 [Deferribacter thermophilus]|uniref:hypothetical protein n=1 Tax=Deferribacter thermophilus TaxID=53573 RepID=UPI003C1BF493